MAHDEPMASHLLPPDARPTGTDATLNPFVVVDGAAELIDFLVEVLGAVEVGSRTQHDVRRRVVRPSRSRRHSLGRFGPGRTGATARPVARPCVRPPGRPR